MFLLLVYAFWDNYKGDVIYSPKIDMYHRTFYTSVLHLINLCYIFGLLRSFLFYCIFYYCLLFLSFLCYHIREKYFFLGNVFVVKFIIPFLKLLLFFGSIIKVGVRKRAYKINYKKIKKVEHIFPKSVKMELFKKPERRNKYALQSFYRKTYRFATH